jgi:hypothetical protein
VKIDKQQILGGIHIANDATMRTTNMLQNKAWKKRKRERGNVIGDYVHLFARLVS